MEESYRWSSPESCPNELTRSNSGASSSKDTLLQSGNATTDKHIGWTNEKHNTFLDCLEASFVKQLHRSMAMLAGSVELNKSCSNSSEKLSAHVNKASEQLPFLHNGCWKKIKKTVRKPPVVYIAADSHDCLKYLHSDGHHHVLDRQTCCELHCKGKRTRDKRSSSCGHETRSHSIHSKPAELQETVCRLAEGSDQNFVDEDFNENSRCKKMKTTSVETTDQEQVMCTSTSSSIFEKMIFNGCKNPIPNRYMCTLDCSNKEYGSSEVASSMFQSNYQVKLEIHQKTGKCVGPRQLFERQTRGGENTGE